MVIHAGKFFRPRYSSALFVVCIHLHMLEKCWGFVGGERCCRDMSGDYSAKLIGSSSLVYPFEGLMTREQLESGNQGVEVLVEVRKVDGGVIVFVAWPEL